MVRLRHYSVEIVQAGIPAAEHKDPTADDTEYTTTTYVEVKEVEKFAIRVTIHEGFELEDYDRLSVLITIDGRCIGGRVYQMTELSTTGVCIKVIDSVDGVVDGRNVRQHFRFDETDNRALHADETIETLRETFADQGTISIEISRVMGYTTRQKSASTSNEAEKPPREIVKEKGSTTTANFETIDRDDDWSQFITTDEEVDVSCFQLKYRTIEALRDLQIAPSLVITRPGEHHTISDDEENPDLVNKIVDMEREMEALRQQIKKETAETFKEARNEKRKIFTTNEPGDTELLNERPVRRRKPTAEDEVIELED